MSHRLTRLLAHARMPLYRNGYLLILNAATTSALGIVYWIVATRYYAKPIVGLNSALIAGMMLLAGIAQLNLNSAMIRFIPRAGRATQRLVGLAYLVTLLVALLVGGIFVLGSGRWFTAQSWLDPSPSFGLWFIAAIMSWCVFTIQDNVLTGLRQTHWIPIENTLFAALKLVLLVVFARWFPTYGIFASWTLPVALTLLPINSLIFGRLIPRHVATNSASAEPIAPRQIVQFVGGNYVGSLFLLLSTTLLPVLVTQLAGPSANASFYMPWMIASSLQLITANLTLSLTVEGALDQAKLREYSYRVLVQSFRLLLPSVLVIMLAAPLILRIFGATYASEGSVLLRLLAIATLPNVLNVLYISIARVQRRIWGIIGVQAALCALVLGLSMVWLPRYGIQGVGWAWLASQTLVACILGAGYLRPLLRAGRQAHIQNEARSTL